MTGNKAYLADYQEFKSGFVAFGGSNGRITVYAYYCQLKVNTASPKLTTARVSAAETKPTESEGFEQIIDFLNGSSVSYALIASPTIRTSCIKKFWTTAKVKTINDEVRIQGLIDEKRVNIKESFIRRTLKLDDAEGTSCLANAEIFDAAKEVGLIQDDVQSLSIPTEPSNSKPRKKHKPKKQQTQAPKVPSHEHMLPSPSNDLLPSGKDSLKLKELMDLCTHLSNKVLELESLEEENRVLKEIHSVHSKVDTAAPVVENEKSFKQERIIADIDEDVEINLEEAQAKSYRMDLEHPKKVLSIHDVYDEEP
nr:hypothetical protein [Tanacetum cinerariifolium]